MRQFMEELLKEELRILALNTREHLKLTQSKMAEKLVMCDHSYSDIEIGQNMCGTLTAFLLLSTLEDPNAFITKTKEKLEKLSQEKMKSEEGGMQLK